MLLIKETKRYLNKLLYICKRMFYVDVGYRKAVSSFVFDTIKELTEEFRSDLDLQDRTEINFIFFDFTSCERLQSYHNNSLHLNLTIVLNHKFQQTVLKTIIIIL